MNYKYEYVRNRHFRCDTKDKNITVTVAMSLSDFKYIHHIIQKDVRQREASSRKNNSTGVHKTDEYSIPVMRVLSESSSVDVKTDGR